MGRIARSWRLLKQSYSVLMKDKELMVLPILSALAFLIVAASFFLGMFGLEGPGEMAEDDPVLIVGGFLFYLVTYTTGIYFQAAVIAGATERLSGGDPTVSSALGAATKRLPVIILWGLIAATVGMILRSIQGRSELVGKIVMGLLGAVWSLAVFFMVPILVMERESVPGSFKRSWALFKKTWGEMVVGNLGFGFLGVLLALPILAVAMLLFVAGLEIVGIAVGALGLGFLALFINTLQGVWVASLYRYATVGEAPEGFDSDLFDQAFRPK